jgi:hypothetical protein
MSSTTDQQAGEGCRRPGETRMKGNARGVQENLWPKFIFKGAPLRATSSADDCSIRFANSKRLKYKAPGWESQSRNCRWRERFTFAAMQAWIVPENC